MLLKLRIINVNFVLTTLVFIVKIVVDTTKFSNTDFQCDFLVSASLFYGYSNQWHY